MLQKREKIYSGKAKSLYQTNNNALLVMEFRDDTTAFDGLKHAKLFNKGVVNNSINAFIMQKLIEAGIPTQFESIYSANESVVKRLDMIPVESVIRNISAGHLCSRLGVEEGIVLNPPTIEFFLKNDELHDPMINESLIQTFGWASTKEMDAIKTLSFKVNEVLHPIFLEAGLLLVDFKLEFGRFDGQVFLGDEFTPDGCRIWDAETGKKLDKDRFRKDLGDVIAAYEEVAQRLGVPLTA